MIEIRDLHLVREIAREGILTKAARNMSLTQSAVSQRLKMIEEKMGLALFSRDRKVMSITPFGKKFLKTADIIDAQLKKLQWESTLAKKGYKETLTFSTECYTTYHWLSNFINALDESVKQRFEPVALSEYTRNPIPFVISGQLDFAVVTSTGEPSLHYVKLFEDELVAICSVRHAWSSAKTLKAHDFINENFFEYNTDGKNLDAYKLFFDKAFTRPRWTTKIDLTEAMHTTCQSEHGRCDPGKMGRAALPE